MTDYTKLGLHVTTGPRNGYGPAASAGPAAVTIVDEFGAMDELPDGTLVILRTQKLPDHVDAPGNFDHWTDDSQAVAAARYYWPRLQAIYEQAVLNHDARRFNLYVQPVNETGGNDPEKIRRITLYELELARLAAGRFRIAAGGLSVGAPVWDYWVDHYPAHLREIAALGGIYVRHAYSGVGTSTFWLIDEANGAPSDINLLRPFIESNHLADLGINIPIVISELGWEGGYKKPPPADLTIDAGLFDKLLLFDPLITAACLWNVGNYQDRPANIQDALPFLANYLSQRQPAPFVGLEPPPPAPGTIDEHMIQLADGHYQAGELMDLNVEAALQKAMPAEFFPVSAERRTSWGGERFAYQVARTKGDDRVSVFHALVGEWDNVRQAPGELVDGRVVFAGEQPPPPDPGTDYLEVAPLSQRDPRWASHPLGQNTGHGLTVGRWGCLMVAYNMMAQYWKLTQAMPDEFNDLMVARGAFSQQYVLPAALRTTFPNRVEYNGYVVRTDPALPARIAMSLDAGAPVPARVDFNPLTVQHDQHWVLIIGVDGDDYIITDPWTGRIGSLADVYGVDGLDVLEAIFYTLKPPPAVTRYNLAPAFQGQDSRVQWVLRNEWGSQEDLQIQFLGQDHWQLIKNTSREVFRLVRWDDGRLYICRSVDNSPGGGRLYTQTEGGRAYARWCPAEMAVGEVYTRAPVVTFYQESNCAQVSQQVVQSNIRLVAVLDEFNNRQWAENDTLPDITLGRCYVLRWEDLAGNPLEQYVISQELGYLVAWRRLHSDPNSPRWSVITEINRNRAPLAPRSVPCVEV